MLALLGACTILVLLAAIRDGHSSRLDQMDLLGHSAGGNVALLYAAAHPERINPDTWVDEYVFLSRPGQAQIQMDLFYDYRTNLPLYPAVQAYFRDRKPPTIIVWGKNDKIFPADGAYPYKRDLPEVEFHLIDSGHFALEDKADEMVPLIRDFLGRKVA